MSRSNCHFHIYLHFQSMYIKGKNMVKQGKFFMSRLFPGREQTFSCPRKLTGSCSSLPNSRKMEVSFLRDRVCSIFSSAGKFCLANGLRQLTWDVKSEVSSLNFRSDVTYAPSGKIIKHRSTIQTEKSQPSING